MSETSRAADEPRRISALLMLGLIVFSPVFVWFLLRRGYARSTRIAAFSYAAVMLSWGVLREHMIRANGV